MHVSANKLNTVAMRQASQAGRRREFTTGQEIGPHQFVRYVGDNPKAPYLVLRCGNCGSEYNRLRSTICVLEKQTKGGCCHCAANRKGKR